MAHKEEQVYAKDLRFTQDSIAARTHFRGEKVLLTELLKKLQSGELKPSDFDPLDLYRDKKEVENKQVWSNDNRRLWLFRKANITEKIKVNVYSEPLKRAPPKYKKDRETWSKADYFPRVRSATELRSELTDPLDEEWEDPDESSEGPLENPSA